MKNIQFIQKNGKPVFAVLPYSLYKRMAENAEMLDDIRAYDEAKAKDDGFRIPLEVVTRELDTGSPALAWREHRGMTQEVLAKKAGISTPYLSQIETGARKGSVKVMKALARTLKVPLDILVDDDT